MKKIKTKKDLAFVTRNIFEALTTTDLNKENNDAKKFFLKSSTTRTAMLFIMTNYFENNKITASDIYSTLHPDFGSKSSFVNFVKLGVKKKYICLFSSETDSRKKYILPCSNFVKMWSTFVAKVEGSEIHSDINWKKIINKKSCC